MLLLFNREEGANDMAIVRMIADTFMARGVNEYTGIWGLVLGLVTVVSIYWFLAYYRDRFTSD